MPHLTNTKTSYNNVQRGKNISKYPETFDKIVYIALNEHKYILKVVF